MERKVTDRAVRQELIEKIAVQMETLVGTVTAPFVDVGFRELMKPLNSPVEAGVDAGEFAVKAVGPETAFCQHVEIVQRCARDDADVAADVRLLPARRCRSNPASPKSVRYFQCLKSIPAGRIREIAGVVDRVLVDGAAHLCRHEARGRGSCHRTC